MTTYVSAAAALSEYDRQAHAHHWYPEVLFGLAHDLLVPGERLLDVGTGTGLAAESFARAGLEVHGFDADPEMLAICAAKGIAALRRHDLGHLPWPYSDASFDHVLAAGVLHFLRDLDPVFAEVRRLLRPGGTFLFTTKAPFDAAGGAGATDVIQGMTLYLHGRDEMDRLMASAGLVLLKEIRLVVTTGRGTDDLFCAFLARLAGMEVGGVSGVSSRPSR